VVCERRGLLVTKDARTNVALRETLAASGVSDLEVGDQGIALILAEDSRSQHLAHVLPLTKGLRSNVGQQHSAAAAVCVRKASLDLPAPLHVLSKLYQLTASEVRVLGAVVESGGVTEISDALGISEATVKTHLQHLFDKTGARRQTDLVKLVASHQSPFRI
jgi:DNA-binding CsgD family transcriptional regulator